MRLVTDVICGDARCARGGVPRGPLPALHGAFLPQCAGEDSRDQAEGRGARAEGDPRAGIAQGMRRKGRGGGGELESMRLGAATRTVRDGFAETLAYTEFPPEHWRRIRTNNGIGRINREIRRRTRVVGTFPNGNSALMLVTARLKRTGPRTAKSICERILSIPFRPRRISLQCYFF